MANFEPVRTLAELDELDKRDILEGYLSAERGDPEPGPNRGKAFWHGWRNMMMDLGAIKMDRAALRLAGEWLERERKRKAAPPGPG